MKTTEKIEVARKLLEANGYYTRIMWTIGDVTMKYDCTDEEAMNVLDNAMQNEATYDQIWMSIDYAAEHFGITKKED